MGMRETIEYCVDSAIKIGSQTYDKSLDFSEESVKIVDGILDGYHERYLHPEEDEGLIREHANTYAHIFGIYVGEVLLRRMDSGCGWAETEYGIVLAKDDRNVINPIAKAYKHIVHGKENGDDVNSFFQIAMMIMEGKLK